MNLDIRTKSGLSELGLDLDLAWSQLSVNELMKHAVKNKEGQLTDTGALALDTGKFTGRSPKDRFILFDQLTRGAVDWGAVNQKFNFGEFNHLLDKVITYLSGNPYYLRQGYACAKSSFRLPLTVITEHAYSSLFANHLFLRDDTARSSVEDNQGWTVICEPGFLADPEIDKTRSANFSILNFSRKIVLIGGTGYTGEIKKGIFSVLNFLLPEMRDVLPMHCSANVGKNGDTALFYGLSGTGKTTLSADPDRKLIGDDEHGWDEDSVFNFEGGCYAKWWI